MACAVTLLGAALGGCIMDDDNCDENQVEVKGDAPVCRCIEGSVPDPRGYGCTLCAENEVVEDDLCVCAPGFGRASDTEPCVTIQGSAAGDACSDSQPCREPNPFCATEGGESYCTTQGCTQHDQCPVDWICDTSSGTGFCAKTSGLGASCTSGDDCAGTDATFCEMFRENICMVEKCATGENACPNSYACCDLTSLVGTSLCVPTESLSGGVCPSGEPPVMP